VTQIIKAFSRVFALAAFPGAPEDAEFISGTAETTIAGPQLIELHNLAASNLGASRVKRFADRTSAERRTWAMLQRLDATSVEDLAHGEADVNKAHIASVLDSADDARRTGDEAYAQGQEDRAAQIGAQAAGSPAAQLSPGDKAQIKDEAAARKPKQSDALLEVAAAAGAKAQAQAALRTSPPTSDNPAKDAEMPALRKAVKVTDLAAKNKVYPRKAGSKQAVLVDLLSRPEGATFGELYDGLAATGKPWKGVTIRSGLAWDINHIAGYGVTSELLNGDDFAKQGRVYEAKRLGIAYADTATKGELPWGYTPGYDPDLKLAVYRLAYPAGMDAPLPHTPKKA
jgi:hypothetical protein